MACAWQVFLSRSRDVGVTAYCGNSRINVEMEYLQSRFCCLNCVTMDTQDLAASISDVELHIGWILVPVQVQLYYFQEGEQILLIQ